jgi:hypothetical protein
MGFYDDVLADVKDVFLELNEFAQTQTIELEGEQYTLPILVDRNVIQAFVKNWDGVSQAELSIAFCASEVTRRPIKGQAMKFNDKRYMVAKCSEEIGLLIVDLEVPEG